MRTSNQRESDMSRITVLDQFTYPEAVRALQPIGVKDATLNAWIQRGQVYGLSKKKGPGPGGRRTYPALAILSVGLMHQLTKYGFTPQFMSQVIIPQIWEGLAGAEKPVDCIWIVELDDPNGKVIKTVLNNSDIPDTFNGYPVLSKFDLAKTVESVLRELENAKADRPSDSLLPRLDRVSETPQTAYGFFHAHAI
jgi:hypothetical protein